jgi:hypothetical protein
VCIGRVPAWIDCTYEDDDAMFAMPGHLLVVRPLPLETRDHGPRSDGPDLHVGRGEGDKQASPLVRLEREQRLLPGPAELGKPTQTRRERRLVCGSTRKRGPEQMRARRREIHPRWRRIQTSQPLCVLLACASSPQIYTHRHSPSLRRPVAKSRLSPPRQGLAPPDPKPAT